jgi:hypothetical protein
MARAQGGADAWHVSLDGRAAFDAEFDRLQVRAIVDGDRIMTVNRETIGRCPRAAISNGETVATPVTYL